MEEKIERNFVEGQEVKVVIGDILYSGYIRGKAMSASYNSPYNFWIFEAENPKFDSELYPYSCMVVIEGCIQD